jgi:hypothetical protein
LAGCQLVYAALDAALYPTRHLLLADGDTNGDPVKTLPHRVVIKRYCFERCGLSGRVSVGLPSKSDSCANRKRDQVSGEGEGLQFAEPAERVQVDE